MSTAFFKRAASAFALCALCLLAPAATASADLIETSACDDAELTQPFKPWLDSAWYKLAPGGDMEGSLSDWTLAGGAAKASGSETHAATGTRGASSLRLPAGASATTPATCVNAAYPTIRFFSRSSGGLLGLLPAMKVELLYRDGTLRIVPLPVGVGVPSSSWQPSLPMLTASAVGAAVAGGEAPLSVRFTSLSGTWHIDDVFVDPLRRG